MKQIRIGKQSKRKVEKDVDNRLKNASNINTKNGDNSPKRTFLADNIDKNKLKNNEIDKFFQKVRNGLSGPSDDRKRKNSRSLRSQQKKSK
ncbi:hypothetical protein MHBO_003412 [Bonamia ostreae]|uniref:Uncharacterized protein n=1 Tax=Bonamia ostreae TaxID=126728 RepID=A0ABV2AQR0_9EUKA